jgi:hypothetical protein
MFFIRRRPKIDDLLNATSARLIEHAEELHKSVQLRIAREVAELRYIIWEGFKMSTAQAKLLLAAIIDIDDALTKQADVISGEHAQLLVVLEAIQNVGKDLEDPDLTDAIRRANLIVGRIGMSIEVIRNIVPDDLLPKETETAGAGGSTDSSTSTSTTGTSTPEAAINDAKAEEQPAVDAAATTTTKEEPDPNAGG